MSEQDKREIALMVADELRQHHPCLFSEDDRATFKEMAAGFRAAKKQMFTMFFNAVIVVLLGALGYGLAATLAAKVKAIVP